MPVSFLFFETVFQDRDVAQLVAHYVRDVGVGRSSRLIPTNAGLVCKKVADIQSLFLF